MDQLVQIFDELERQGWVCILKWDGERASKTNSVVVSRSSDGKLFRGDFTDFDRALEHVQSWLREQGPASSVDVTAEQAAPPDRSGE
jgi:hypothetical protein